jgi:hypothetical protein
MTYIRLSERLRKLAARAIKSSRCVALAILATFTLLALRPAQAQSADTWKSVAIIGGSTAAGAYVGHKVAGSTGALIGAGVGASAGYVIDRRRRANAYNNQYAYGDGGYYGTNGAYYGNGEYDGGPYASTYPYPSGYQSNNYYRTSNRFSHQR